MSFPFSIYRWEIIWPSLDKLYPGFISKDHIGWIDSWRKQNYSDRCEISVFRTSYSNFVPFVILNQLTYNIVQCCLIKYSMPLSIGNEVYVNVEKIV